MAVPVVASTTTFADTVNATSRNLAYPASTAAGDWLIVGVAIDGTATINTPTGFTDVYARTDTDSSSNLKVFKRKADGTESGNITVSTSSEIACGFCARVTGADATEAVDVLSDWTGSPDTQSAEDVGTYPPVYARYDDSLVLRVTGWDDGTTTITNPSGHTEIANVGAASSGAKLQACYKGKATAGLEAAAGFAVGDTTELGSAVTILIRSTGTPAALPAQPYFLCGSFHSSDASASTALAYQKPYGTVDGDLLLLVQTADAAATLSPPGAFTSIRDTNNGTAVYHQAYYRVASSEGSSYTGSAASTTAKVGALVRIVNADPTSPVNASSSATGTSAAPAAATITPSVNNCLILFTLGCDDDEVAFGSGTPTGFDSLWSVSTEEGLDVGLVIAKDEQTTAGATGSIATTITASEEWVAFAIAVAPAASAGVTANPTGVAGTGSPGTAAATGTASVAPTGLSAGGSAGTVPASVGQTTALTGPAAAGTAGTPTATGTAAAALTGPAGAGQVGTASASVSESTALVGLSASGGVGSPTASGTAVANPTGTNGTGTVGTVAGTGAASVALAGLAGSGGVGTPSANGGASNGEATPDGLSSAASPGTVAATGGANASPTGLGSTGSPGAPTSTGTSSAPLTGSTGTGQTGAPTATGDSTSALAGSSGQAHTGTLTGAGSAIAALTGPGGLGGAGTIAVQETVSTLLSGLRASTAVGSVITDGSVLATAIGVSAQGLTADILVLRPSGLNVLPVPAEDRTIQVAVQERRVTVANDNRITSPAAEPRTVTVHPEPRVIRVAA